MKLSDPRRREKRPTNPSHLLVFCGLAVVTMLWIYCAIILVGLREKAWSDVTSRSENLLLSVERTLDRNIELYDLSLQAVIERLRNPLLESATPEIRQLGLFDRAAQAPGYGDIFVLDQNGDAFLDSGSVIPRKLNGADRPYFRSQVARDAGLFLGAPWMTRISGREMIPLSRRLTYADDTFAGVVVGAIELRYFGDIFSKINRYRDLNIEMYFDDGNGGIVHRQFDRGVPDQEISKQDQERIVAVASGSFITRPPSGLKDRLNTFMRVGKTPLHVNVTSSIDMIDAAWWPQAASILIVVSVLTLGVTALLFVLQLELARRTSAESELSRLSLTDALTGIPNRRHFDRFLQAAGRGEQRGDIAIVMFDTDFFKKYNDRYGHPAGDQVLRQVSSIILRHAQDANGLAFRIGGEEFGMILIGVSESRAIEIAEATRHGVEAGQEPHADGIGGVITVSAGLIHTSRYPAANESQWLSLADDALYRAKNSGRNCVYASGMFQRAPATGSATVRPRALADTDAT